MTKYLCRKCKVQMKVVKEFASTFRYVIKCPKCGMEITVNHKEDIG